MFLGFTSTYIFTVFYSRGYKKAGEVMNVLLESSVSPLAFVVKKSTAKGQDDYLWNLLFNNCYVAETWTMNEIELSRLQATKIRFLRTIVQKTNMDKIRNSDICSDLGMDSLMSMVERSRLWWFGHVKKGKIHLQERNFQSWDCKISELEWLL